MVIKSRDSQEFELRYDINNGSDSEKIQVKIKTSLGDVVDTFFISNPDIYLEPSDSGTSILDDMLANLKTQLNEPAQLLNYVACLSLARVLRSHDQQINSRLLQRIKNLGLKFWEAYANAIDEKDHREAYQKLFLLLAGDYTERKAINLSEAIKRSEELESVLHKFENTLRVIPLAESLNLKKISSLILEMNQEAGSTPAQLSETLEIPLADALAIVRKKLKQDIDSITNGSQKYDHLKPNWGHLIDWSVTWELSHLQDKYKEKTWKPSLACDETLRQHFQRHTNSSQHKLSAMVLMEIFPNEHPEYAASKQKSELVRSFQEVLRDRRKQRKA